MTPALVLCLAICPPILPVATQEPEPAPLTEIQMECLRFCPQAEAECNFAFLAAHLVWCQGQLALNTDRPWFAEYTKIVNSHYNAWLYIASAHQSCEYSPEWAWDVLDMLYDWIGADAYELGLMPHPLPFLALDYQ